MNNPRRFFARLAVLLGLVFIALGRTGTPQSSSPQPQRAKLPQRTALDDYVAKPDKTYSWKLVNTIKGEGYSLLVVDMTSQTWRTTADVDTPVWRHWLTIVQPDTIASNKALLFISGGGSDDAAPTKADPAWAKIATSTSAVVAELRMIPNQPLIFGGDGRKRKEDDLIAYTWDKVMRTGDPTWTARMPMVKSAVRAMDTIQSALATPEAGNVKIDQFVVAGGSKRGWTTWLTGAVDKRVVAVIPIVIDILNVQTAMKHHYAAYGFWSPAVGDYVNHGIVDWMDTPEYSALLAVEDPYSYRHRLTIPKFILNASGDEFFLPDSSQFYFNDLVGEKHLRYVPNAKHSLDGSDARETVLAYFKSIVDGRKRPEFSWTLEPDGSIRVKTIDKPTEVNLWQATNPNARDFRLDTIGKAYTSSPLKEQPGGIYVGSVAKPEKGWTAFFVELVYDGGLPAAPLKFTTEVRVVPDVLPFKDTKIPHTPINK